MTTEPTAVTCPWCSAAPGRPCVLRDGTLAYKTHSDRRKAAQRTPTEPTGRVPVYWARDLHGESRVVEEADHVAALRACAQRVHEEVGDPFAHAGWNKGYRDALDAAMEAVAALLGAPSDQDPTPLDFLIYEEVLPTLAALRACEERVLDAALEAVAANVDGRNQRERAMAAIAALKGDDNE